MGKRGQPLGKLVWVRQVTNRSPQLMGTLCWPLNFQGDIYIYTYIYLHNNIFTHTQIYIYIHNIMYIYIICIKIPFPGHFLWPTTKSFPSLGLLLPGSERWTVERKSLCAARSYAVLPRGLIGTFDVYGGFYKWGHPQEWMGYSGKAC